MAEGGATTNNSGLFFVSFYAIPIAVTFALEQDNQERKSLPPPLSWCLIFSRAFSRFRAVTRRIYGCLLYKLEIPAVGGIGFMWVLHRSVERRHPETPPSAVVYRLSKILFRKRNDKLHRSNNRHKC